jgi:hypothetical protein
MSIDCGLKRNYGGEGPEGGVNESQTKLLTGTWLISQNQPDAPLF